jgi:hypothetical protein
MPTFLLPAVGVDRKGIYPQFVEVDGVQDVHLVALHQLRFVQSDISLFKFNNNDHTSLFTSAKHYNDHISAQR